MKPTAISYATILASALFLIACTKEPASEESQRAPAIQVQEYTIAERHQPIAYITSGSVVSQKHISVSSRLSGYLREIRVNEGDIVSKGQVLARMDPVDTRAEVENAKADFADAAADLKRFQDLIKENAVSRQQFDKAKLRFDTAKSNLEKAQNQLLYADIRAATDGVVIEKHLHTGDLVLPGNSILTIADPHDLRVETYVSERYLERIKVNDRVTVVLTAVGRSFVGTVAGVVPVADPVSHQFLVKIRIPGPESVFAGMFTEVHFTVGERIAILVPRQFIVDRAGLHGVYVVEADGTAHYRQVRLGKGTADSVEVLAGLRSGYTIATPVHAREVLVSGMHVTAER